MTEWDKLWTQIEDSDVLGDLDKTLIFEIQAGLLNQVKTEGGKLHQVNKELKKELESCAEKSWIKREKLEAIHNIIIETKEHCDKIDDWNHDSWKLEAYEKVLEMLDE